MHHLAFHQERRRDDIANSDSTDSTEEILRFLPASERSTEIEGEIALRLVFQVAEVIRGTEDRANAIEKRAQSLVESAVDELKHAGDLIQKLETERHAIKARMSEEIREAMDRANAIEKRARNLAEGAADELKRAKNQIQELETERQVAEARMSEVSATMQETEKALKCAVSQLAAAEDQVVQAELRARKAEMRASEMTIALRSIEEALRTRPLGQRPAPSSKLSAAA